jgi:uncharacterized protein YceK
MKAKNVTLVFLLVLSMGGCSSMHHDLMAPCTNYGKFCQKTPINSDTQLGGSA